MAKMDYNSINFRNKDVDKFATKFGKEKTDPEEQAKKDAIRTKGMTENEINLYNQKSKFGQKVFAKQTAKQHLADEQAKNKPAEPAAPKLTPQEQEALRVSKNARRTNTLNAAANILTPIAQTAVEITKSRQQSQP